MSRAVIETDRLVLRRFVPDDIEWLAPMLGDPATLEHWDRPLTHAESVQWIDRNLERYAAEGYGLWVVEHDGEPVGDCGIVAREVEGEPEVEVGYHLARRHWGNGYATEAAEASIDYARKAGIDRVIALILPENARSQAVARRVGLTPGREVIHAGRPHVVWGLAL